MREKEAERAWGGKERNFSRIAAAGNCTALFFSAIADMD